MLVERCMLQYRIQFCNKTIYFIRPPSIIPLPPLPFSLPEFRPLVVASSLPIFQSLTTMTILIDKVIVLDMPKNFSMNQEEPNKVRQSEGDFIVTEGIFRHNSSRKMKAKVLISCLILIAAKINITVENIYDVEHHSMLDFLEL